MSSNEPSPLPADVAPVTDAAVAPAPMAAEPSPAAVAQQLKQLFPALFSGAPKPIKLRIQIDIQARAPGLFTKQALSAFFRRHTGSTSYLLAVANGTQRFDLDGQPQGDISDEHRQVAATELARRRANHLATQNASRAEADLKEQQRRNRAGLLHDYERTTLTRANFCVLKGVAEPELDGLLAIAREEAARPRGPEPREMHDSRNPRRPPQPAPRTNLGGRHGR
jgi:ProP effector